MGKKLFGTDGIRGVAGEYPLDAATIYAAGVCLGREMKSRGGARALIGMDTRRSGPEIAGMLAAGLMESGAEVEMAGVIPTAAVAFLTTHGGFGAGVMISASHNSYEDNGIKIFGPKGIKISDEEEARLEEQILGFESSGSLPPPVELEEDFSLANLYLGHLIEARNPMANLAKLTIIADCANGAASPHAWRFFGDLGVIARLIFDQPNGSNINRECGSLHLDAVQQMVLFNRAQLGVAFDGDADRALFVADDGEEVNGDGILLLSALYLKQLGRLDNDLVVATVMSNMGLEAALRDAGITLLRTPVGDKYVLEKMIETGAVLGGEQSGHIIFREYSNCGDGLVTARIMLEMLATWEQPLSVLRQQLPVYPQKLLNLPVQRKPPIEEIPGLMEAVSSVESELDGRGRVLVRYSGTERLLRVMVEAESHDDVERHVSRLAGIVEAEIGE